MSFDLSLSKGDLTIDTNGDFKQVRDNTKLVQDVLKVLHTPIGSDPYFPSKGSPLTDDNIGQILNQQFLQDKAEASIITVLQIIQSLQQMQARVQTVTPGEIIKDINNVTVVQDSVDPRQYNISISVVTGSLTGVTLTDNFSISTDLST